MAGKPAWWRKALWPNGKDGLKTRQGRQAAWRRLAVLGAGACATGLAMLLAFHVGQDLARSLAGGDDDAPQALPTALAEAAPAPAAQAATPPAVAAPAVQTPAADTPFVVKSVLKIDGPIRFGQFYWDESQSQAGPVVITVDLTARVLSVFRDGHEIGATAILKGYGDKPTPLGVFPITQKDATHVSNLYDAPMPWMLRLTNDGVSIHGSKVEKGYATNGCVGVPDEFAKRLFKVASLGDKVIITDGKRLGLGGSINPGA
ncbi:MULTISPECIES: L,D-transpeptidase family protein [unclassified Novosphingobium]|uniref:L,D-transpeptidase family protein n=1 Tax=unclassified Novosphingobium TaxID=2644732 RepID=UPI0017E7A2E0|nr:MULTISPECIES: L,D-transpeptidase family protein [unclassified Novosphingobium]MBB3359474.1 lipoprotein-anchoring transpeptidase ErfK/SrfK [Novosphingobium sp. BK256]MBB3375834.1 lipoprotein-anchoring transpeptidase ErfK/SrfK [Novosphingobium sp. BK280]MBB3380247.1 lipoprotein-anchoring transpeptidase ErfK/SrfK [Novosphingobium sp. BK258]MBB3421941.1 lipoprotein-anchoring transpeptidase ErfK/SrfK [Novosphingobium sp. BK267]MBB3450597.1 lipoprotein-anchoring transpeptidase ErfK/SrfK [Novosphi